MKILVMDDNGMHRAAAVAQLKEHDLTVVGTYKEAEKLLTPQRDYKKLQSMLKAEFGSFERWGSDGDQATKDLWDRREKEISKEITVVHNFDVVLTDLLIPTEKGFGGQEIPMGAIIALRAIAAGAKYVAIVTDANHHQNAASAAFDGFPQFTAGDVTVRCTNRCTAEVDPISFEKRRNPDGSIPSGLVSVKDWARVLKELVKGVPSGYEE